MQVSPASSQRPIFCLGWDENEVILGKMQKNGLSVRFVETVFYPRGVTMSLFTPTLSPRINL